MPKLKGRIKNRLQAIADPNSFARLTLQKSTDMLLSYINHIISYSVVISNIGNTAADNVIITDAIQSGTALIPNSLIVSAPYTPLPAGAIRLNNPINSGDTVIINFKLLVTAIPSPNPIVNLAQADFTFNNGQAIGSEQSNAVSTTVFRYNFSQQISDLIESVALEQAALAAIANAEGSKVQRMAAIQGITTQQLLCLNKSVNDMMDSITMLEAVLRQKLSIVNCQINGVIC